MKYFAVVSEPARIGEIEIECLFDIKTQLSLNIVVFSTERKEFFPRLAYSKAVYELLFMCTLQQLEKTMEKFNWQDVYEKNFCLRVHGTKEYTAPKLAGYIWRAVKNPKVELDSPKTKIEIFCIGKQVYAGKLLLEIENDFESRKAHLRPVLFPSSLHPKLARAMVNMVGILDGAVTDPFCGTGGILLEAGLMRLKCIGFDIKKEMVDATKANLDSLKISQYKLKVRDATKLGGKLENIVTDLPYGRNTKIQNGLYKRFFSLLNKKLSGSAVVGIPADTQFRKLLGKLRLKGNFKIYLHKSMSKRILVLNHLRRRK